MNIESLEVRRDRRGDGYVVKIKAQVGGRVFEGKEFYHVSDEAAAVREACQTIIEAVERQQKLFRGVA